MLNVQSVCDTGLQVVGIPSEHLSGGGMEAGGGWRRQASVPGLRGANGSGLLGESQRLTLSHGAAVGPTCSGRFHGFGWHRAIVSATPSSLYRVLRLRQWSAGPIRERPTLLLRYRTAALAGRAK
jgi:hypothetical protein